jgi:hypothetical protein
MDLNMDLNKNRFAIVFLLLIAALATQSGHADARTSNQAVRQVNPDEGTACKRLSEVKETPLKDESVDDEAYNDIISRGKAAIPCLIGEITNTTRMEDPRPTPKYPDFRVGDLAFFLLVRITKIPFEQMLPNSVKSRIKNEGVYAYFEYVERLNNRKALQARWKAWWEKQRQAVNRSDSPLTMVYSTFLGGSQVDDCDAVATDPKGDIYLGCHSDSPNLPGSESAPYALKGDLDAFVIKLDSKASRVLYLAQVSGRDWEGAMGIAVDSTGAAYITGSTYSPDFPTTAGAFQRAFAGDNDAFVVKVSPTGSIVYATFLGGKGRDDGRRIAIDRSGAAYIVGSTNSPDFPTTAKAFQPRYGGDTDAFVVKLSPSGALLYSTYLGGSLPENGFGVAVSSSGNAYVTGNSRSANFPIVKPLQNSLRGDSDAFIAKLNTTGSSLLFSTYLGGSDYEYGYGIALDTSNRIFLTGTTMSSDFPISRGAFQTAYGGKWDGFVTKLAAPGNGILYSSYLGGAGDEGGAQIAVSPGGRAYIVGGTESSNFPTARPAQASMRGTKDGFLVEIDPTGTSLLFSTYLGGGNRELFEDVALDAEGAVILSGLTSSDDFPVVRGMQKIFGGAMYDIVIAKFAHAKQYRAR